MKKIRIYFVSFLIIFFHSSLLAYSSDPENFVDELVKDTEMVIVSDGPDDRKIKMTGFPVKLSNTPAQLFRSPPKLGEHTHEILSKLKK